MRILLVEDEAVLAEALEAALKKENFLVDVVLNGTDGLDNALTGIYDILILDIMLPGMSGLEILQQVRRYKLNTRVIMLTARSQVEDRIKGLDFGADDYLTKPFHIGELLARLRALSRRDFQTGETDGLRFGDLFLDTRLCEVSCCGSDQKMKLGVKEFQLFGISHEKCRTAFVQGTNCHKNMGI